MKRILLLKNRALGDSIIGLSTVQYVKELLPDCHVVYGVPDWVSPLYKNISTAADGYLPFKLKGFLDWIRMTIKIRREKFDAIIELQQGGRTARFFKLFFRKKYFYHNHNKKNGNFVVDQGVRKAIIQRDLDGCYSALNFLFGVKSLPNYLEYRPEIKCCCEEKNQIVLGVTAARKTKMWGLENFKEVVEQFPGIEFIIPLSNNEIDRQLEEEVKSLQIRAKVVKKSLDELPMELAGSRCYIGNDTGLKHLCVALGMPTFTFFGPEEPMEWHPYNTSDHKYYFKNECECRTQVSHYCGLEQCELMTCMNALSAEDVVNDLKELL